MYRDELKRLGTNIRMQRMGRGLSQEKLAELSGLHRTYIGAVERGERNISIKNVIRIAKALEIKLTELLSNVE